MSRAAAFCCWPGLAENSELTKQSSSFTHPHSIQARRALSFELTHSTNSSSSITLPQPHSLSSLTQELTHSRTHALKNSFTTSFTRHSLAHSLTRSLAHSRITHALTHSLPHSLASSLTPTQTLRRRHEGSQRHTKSHADTTSLRALANFTLATPTHALTHHALEAFTVAAWTAMHTCTAIRAVLWDCT